MTKQRLIEIYSNNPEVIYDAQMLLKYDTIERTGFIVDKLLPAVRDNEEFKREFIIYMEKDKRFIYDEMFGKICAIGIIGISCGGDEDTADIPLDADMLLGFELDFCREIIGKE